jgi:hypothetical protein
MPDLVSQDKFKPEFMFQDDFMPKLMLLDDSKPDFMFLDDVMPKNQTVWLTRIYEVTRRFWSIDNPGTGNKILPSTWSDVLRTTASRRQRHIMTLISHEGKDCFDLEHGTFPRKEREPDLYDCLAVCSQGRSRICDISSFELDFCDCHDVLEQRE